MAKKKLAELRERRQQAAYRLARERERAAADEASVIERDRRLVALRADWIAACEAENAASNTERPEGERPGPAWRGGFLLERHPPRFPAPWNRISPSHRTDDPRGLVVAPCVDGPSRITRYALEVIDAPLLHDLLSLWSLAEDPDRRFFFSSDGSAWRSRERVAAANTKQARQAVKRSCAGLKLGYETPAGLRVDERHLQDARAERDRSPLVDKQVTRERLYVLRDLLHLEAGWTYRDIAELIIASEGDWTRPPIGRIREDLRVRDLANPSAALEDITDDGQDFAGNVEKWIQERLYDERRKTRREA